MNSTAMTTCNKQKSCSGILTCVLGCVVGGNTGSTGGFDAASIFEMFWRQNNNNVEMKWKNCILNNSNIDLYFYINRIYITSHKWI